jgi:2-polyprenyl-3-methyl-5-hydroxy-6-metoxy-1,4-benzoquinol methylase
MNPERARWNEKHRRGGHDAPSVRLIMHLGRLTRGRALDVAGGAGDNAAVLALAGWQVTLADLSDEALSRAGARTRELRADVRLVQADALRLPFRGPFETIVVTDFLERSIAPALAALMAPGGTIFAETFRRGLPEVYCVGAGEFARLFPGLEPVLEAEEGDRAVFIGRKRPWTGGSRK